MTNWPNIQEYRNFEAKFVNDSTNNLSINSAAESGSSLKNDCKIQNSLDDFLSNQQCQNFETKTVRCVIKKDFEETFKKLDRGDGIGINHETAQAKPQEAAVVNQLLVEQIRLQNHLKWKKQKEEEYLQKKEAERIAQQKKKEEELRLQRMKKQKEKEREEKLREWQEQKAREKEEKKKEKMVLKVLEEELKVAPTVNKEKLIGEWVKLKDKQKQMEAEKKAELQKKEEESRELRQNLAKLSYQKWKESIKGRMMALPKNGYQIFGPKPAPVVKEDWNHDFTSSSPRNQSINVRHTKSNTSTTLMFRPAVKELEDFSKNVYYLGDLKTRSPSFCHLRTATSGMNLSRNCEVTQNAQLKLPLKELQQGTIDSHKNDAKTLKNNLKEKEDFILQYFNKTSCTNFLSKLNEKEKYSNLYQCSPDFLNLPSMEGDQNQSVHPPQCKKLPSLMKDFADHQVLPNKKKLDLYLNTGSNNTEESSSVDHQKKPLKANDVKVHKEEKKDLKDKKILNNTLETKSREKFCPRTRFRSTSLQKEAKCTAVNVDSKKPVEDAKTKICRKSRSCEKPVKKLQKDPEKVKYSSSSRALAKVNGKVDDGCKKFGATKSMICCNQKKKTKKQLKPETPVPTVDKSEKKRIGSGSKTNKKFKKNGLLKSFSFSDSPYNSKNSSKSLSKVKGRRKNTKDGETKSDGAGRSRKLSTTKI